MPAFGFLQPGHRPQQDPFVHGFISGLVRLRQAGNRFTLPDEAWWADFYTPMQHRINELRGKYDNDAEAVAILDQLAQEPGTHRRYSDCYAYDFFVARRLQTGSMGGRQAGDSSRWQVHCV